VGRHQNGEHVDYQWGLPVGSVGELAFGGRTRTPPLYRRSARIRLSFGFLIRSGS
jgi:hypothetical protein